jgi:Trk K+ transport system NAD-binding subunit
MTAPIVLCGLGRTGARVLTYLRAAGLPVVVVDSGCKPDDPRLRGARFVCGDCREPDVLARAGVAGARGVLVLVNDDLVNVSAVLQVRALDPNVRVIVRLFDQNLLDRLGHTVPNVVALSTAMLTAPVLAMTAMTGAAIGAFRVGEQDEGHLVAELIVTSNDRLHGRTIAEAVESRGAACLAHLSTAGQEQLPGRIDPSLALQSGDLVVTCGRPSQLAPLLGTEGEDRKTLRWANYAYRLGRMAWRSLAELDALFLTCLAVLLIVVAISTVVLHLGVTRYSIPTALFRTVSIMATSSDMYLADFEDKPRLQVFVSCLRIIGAVLLAAFTAITTNYLLRARLGGVLEVRRIPESGHVVVCGLGAIGFLTLKELLRCGERVVAIEKDLTNPFVATARRLGAAVIIGDAALPEVQKQAKMQTAYSVIASTSNDVSNLSVALLAREANRGQRVVVLLADPTMAKMLRQAAGVDLALSVPALAAPAFLAALYGDRVRTVVLARQHMLAVLDVTVQPGGPLQGLSVATAAAHFRFCLIALTDELGTPLNEPTLAAGHRLVLVTALPDVEAILSRTKAPDVLPARGRDEGEGR